MCFSAQADLIGGVAITGVGIDAIRHTRGRRGRYLLLAALPLLFGTHQLVETFVWWGLQGHLDETIGYIATWLYLLFAFVVLPIYLPVSVLTLEPRGPGQWAIGTFAVLGTAVSVVLLVTMLRNGVNAELASFHIAYGIGLEATVLVVSSYVLVTCGSLLFSGTRTLAVFGVVNFVAVAALAMFAINGFASLWCAWAALTSAGFALYLRRSERAERARESVGGELA